MRKLSSAAVVAAMTGVALLGHTPTASATAGTCSDNYSAAVAGYMYAYEHPYCDGAQLGRAVGNDLNWGDSSQSFQGTDIRQASSVLNKGNYSEVKFFPAVNADTPLYVCLLRSEGYASNLTDDYWMQDPRFGSVDDSIAGHMWVERTACAFMVV